MGGHGGLNILPQKRWNVYNRDNRLKVARDEEKQRQAEEAAQQRHVQAESEHRHDLLLQRARGQCEHVIAGQDWQAAAGPVPSSHALMQQQRGQPLQHINLFEEEAAAAAMHPDTERELADEKRRRGNPHTYTSDAKFDERFQLAYGLGKEQPWYARRIPSPKDVPPSTTFSTIAGPNTTTKTIAGPKSSINTIAGPSSAHWSLPPSQCKLQPKPALHLHPPQSPAGHADGSKDRHGSKRKHQLSSKHKSKHKRTKSKAASLSCGTSQDAGGIDNSGSSGARVGGDSESERSSDSRGRRVKKSSKTKKKWKSGKDRESSRKRKELRSRRKELVLSGVPPRTGMSSIEQLRMERLWREHEERSKARMVLFGTLDREPRSVDADKRYNSGFGYAPPQRLHRR